MTRLRYLPNVVTLELDRGKCIGCGMCILVCPHAVFRMDGQTVSIADRDACMECGACTRNCPTVALSVKAGVGCATAIIRGALPAPPRMWLLGQFALLRFLSVSPPAHVHSSYHAMLATISPQTSTKLVSAYGTSVNHVLAMSDPARSKACQIDRPTATATARVRATDVPGSSNAIIMLWRS